MSITMFDPVLALLNINICRLSKMITYIVRYLYPSTTYDITMNTIELLGSLGRYPVFDLATFASIANLRPDYAKVRLFRLTSRGLVRKVLRNVYTVHSDPVLVASRMVWPSYISIWYAMSHHGLTDQVPHEIQVITTRATYRRALIFMGTRISFIRVRPGHFFGYEKTLRGGHEVFMATPEKAIIDAALLRRISMSELFDILKRNIDVINVTKMVGYMARCDNTALSKRLGFMLDTLGHDAHAVLSKDMYPSLVRLDASLPDRGPVKRKWGIRDNIGVVG